MKLTSKLIAPKLIALGLAGAIAATAAAPASAGPNSGARYDNGVQIRLVVKDHDRKGHNAHRLGKKQRFMSERELRRVLHRNGFRDIKRTELQPRRAVYVAYAEKRGGRDYRVTVNARNGRIIDVDKLDRGRRGHGPRHGDRNKR